ncbi:MAG TPA: hypothetical protein VIS07_02575 [Candidatus Binatia bacterium]
MRESRGVALAVAVVASAVWVSSASAAPFGFVGPRQLGMGGAGVAATEDAHAIYWNPAGLALRDGLDIRLSGTVRAAVNDNLDDAIRDVKNAINSGDTPQEIIDRVDEILSGVSSGSSGGTNGGGGLFVKYAWDDNAIGFAFLDVFNGTASLPLIDRNTFFVGGRLFNGSVVALDGLEGRQIALSYARSLFDDTLSLGVTASALQGVVYLDRSFIQEGRAGLEFAKHFSDSRDDWDASVDVGGTWLPTPWLRFAIVGKYLNRPTFDIFDLSDVKIDGTPPGLPPEFLERIRTRLAESQGRFQLAPQGRASVAAYPIEGMTLTADVDVTPNPTFVRGADSQIMSVGGEQLFLDDMLAGRLGVYYDFLLPGSDPVPTIGFGVSFMGFSFDIAGAYDFDESAGALGVGFGYTM